MIGDVARIIISVTEKIESFIDLIVEGMEILVSQSSTIIDDVEIIVKETELIVTIVLSKGKTGGTETKPKHPDTALTLNNLAVLYKPVGRFSDANRYIAALFQYLKKPSDSTIRMLSPG